MKEIKTYYDLETTANKICSKIKDPKLIEEIDLFKWNVNHLEQEINKKARIIQSANFIDDLDERNVKNLCLLLCENMDLMERILKLTDDIDFEYELPIQIGKLHTEVQLLMKRIDNSTKSNKSFFRKMFLFSKKREVIK
jgi:hypothetical protein